MRKRGTAIATMVSGLIFSATSFALGQTLVFPHVANGLIGDGTFWSTEIELVNTSLSQQNFKISFFSPDGTPMTMFWPAIEAVPPSGLGSFSSLSRTLAPNAMFVMESDGGFKSGQRQNRGWALIEGTGGIKAALTFRRRSTEGDILAQAGVLPQAPSTSIDFLPAVRRTFADNIPFHDRVSAFALANASGDLTASGEIQLVDQRGNVVATSPFVVPPRGQVAQFVTERFGSISEGFDSLYLRVRVNGGSVSALALSTVGTLISTIPTN